MHVISFQWHHGHKIEMWLVTAPKGNLSDYLVFVAFLARPFIREGFISFGDGLLQLCVIIDEDEEVDLSGWFPGFTANQFNDTVPELDQPIGIHACLLVALTSSGMIHTKNLKNTRSRLAGRLGLTIADTDTVIEE
jgi:hypothetical protein